VDSLTNTLLIATIVLLVTPMYVRFWHWFMTKRRVQGVIHRVLDTARVRRANRRLRQDLKTSAARLRICANWLKHYGAKADSENAYKYAEYALESAERIVK